MREKMITVDDTPIFCSNCGSRDLEILYNEELLALSCNSKSTEVLHCKTCNRYFTVEWVEENLDDFSSEEALENIMKRRAWFRNYYA